MDEKEIQEMQEKLKSIAIQHSLDFDNLACELKNALIAAYNAGYDAGAYTCCAVV